MDARRCGRMILYLTLAAVTILSAAVLVYQYVTGAPLGDSDAG